MEIPPLWYATIYYIYYKYISHLQILIILRVAILKTVACKYALITRKWWGDNHRFANKNVVVCWIKKMSPLTWLRFCTHANISAVLIFTLVERVLAAGNETERVPSPSGQKSKVNQTFCKFSCFILKTIGPLIKKGSSNIFSNLALHHNSQFRCRQPFDLWVFITQGFYLESLLV